MFSKSSIVKYIGHFVIFMGLIIIFAMNVHRAKILGVFENQPMAGILASVPAALTNILSPSNPRYMESTAIRDAFWGDPWHAPSSASEANETILKISTNPDFQKGLNDFIILGNCDKGSVDFVELSFRVFGLKIQSITIAYYTLLFISLFMFCWRYWKNPLALVSLGCVLLAEFQVLPSMVFYKQLESPLEVRALPILSIIACFHCALYYWKEKISVGDVVALFIQCLIMLFVYHMRITALWQFLVLAGLGACIVGRYYYSKLLGKSIQSFSGLFIKMMPVLFVIVSLMGLNLYRTLVFPIEYDAVGQTKTHVFWHNIYSGFALHPKIAEEHSLRIDDMSPVVDALNFLEQRQEYERWKLIGGGTNFMGIKWAPYELVVREMLVDVCSKNKLACIESFLIYKPFYFLDTLTWFYGLKEYPLVSDVFVSKYVGDIVKQQVIKATEEMNNRKMNAAPWGSGFVGMLFIMTLGLFLAKVRQQQDLGNKKILASLSLIALASMLPSIVGYPSPHGMADSVVLFNAVLQTALVVLLILSINIIREYALKTFFTMRAST